MCIRMKKRSFIRIITYALSVFFIVTVFVVSARTEYMSERQKNEYGYQRALLSLSESIENIDVTLEKTLCAGSAEQFAALAAKLCVDAATAKSELGQLPASMGELDNINRFISQVGSYAVSLANKRYLDEDLTADELKQLRELEKYTAKLRLTLSDILAKSAERGIWLGDYEKHLDERTENANGKLLGGNTSVMAEDFTDYPTLIYDGPFSDHIYDKKPALIKDKEGITAEYALEKARSFSGNNALEYTRCAGGNLPMYVFSADGIEIAVTVQGGEIAYMINSRPVRSTKFNEEDAHERAKRYLREHGYENMTGSYYEINSNCCVLSFTSSKDDIVFYPDMIKVAVALDNGEIVEFDARDYIMNHHDRGKLTASKSAREAEKIVSRQLEPEKVQLAVIPTDAGEEKLCWEFLCEGEDTEVLVYINADNLREERILLVLENENGKLTI